MSQRKRNIEFSRPDEPSFLKKLKNQIGYQNNEVTIETKKEKLSKKDLDYRDEEPVYVIDQNSEITEQELENFKEKTKQENESRKNDEIFEQKIIFKKPDKNASINSTNETFQSTNKLANNKLQREREQRNELRKNQIKTIKNSSLLSFNEEENDDPDEEDNE